jgi:hypothetical protein
MIEINRELAGTQTSMRKYLGTSQSQAPLAPTAPQGAAPQAGGGGGQLPRVRQNGHVFERQPDGSMKFIE